MSYKFAHPHAWLRYAVAQGTVTADDLVGLIDRVVSADDIQDEFQSNMDADGYFDPNPEYEDQGGLDAKV